MLIMPLHDHLVILFYYHKSFFFLQLNTSVTIRDENIRYIHRYIFDISDIDDVRHDIDDDRYISDISVLDRYIVEISGLWHTCALF